MAGTTTNGLPYPESTDFVTDGAQAIEDLALAVDSEILQKVRVLQIVTGSSSTQTDNNTDTYADTGLTATITPSSTSSKILIFVTQAGVGKRTGNSISHLHMRLLRGATEIIEFDKSAGYNATSSENTIGSVSTVYLDSPNTTSATTYKTQFRNNVNATGVRVQTNGASSRITLVEVLF